LLVEKLFAGKRRDDVVREPTKANTDNVDIVIAEYLAHQKRKTRTAIVEATLRQLDTFNDRFGLESIPDELTAVLEGLTALPGKEYGDIVLAADAIIRNSKVPSFDNRVQELRAHLLEQGTP
jgi:Acetyl-CoA carboxylase, central region